MTRQELDGSVVGIAAFLDPTPRSALHGVIKQQQSDFIVQEITTDGQILSLAGDWDGIPSSESRSNAVQIISKAREAKQQRTKEALVFETPECGWREELQRLMGDAVLLERMERVATETGEQDSSLLINAPTDFRERVYLQVCIQNCFPALDCRVKKTPMDTNQLVQTSEGDVAESVSQQIEIAQDGLYKKFIKAELGVVNASALVAFVRRGANHPDASSGFELNHGDDKQTRSALHRQISSATTLLRTRTETRDGKQRIFAFFSPQITKKRKRADQEPEPYLRFVLQKTNVEHFACVEKLGRHVKRPVSAFGFAGTKDKVAVTYQHVTVQGVQPEQLLALNGEETGSGFRIGHIEYTTLPMTLGSLTGNRFTIIVRELPRDATDEEISSRVTRVAGCGFLNYFGFQRVGLPSSSVRQHQIGERIVAGKWEAAIDKLFAVTNLDPPECAKAKTAFRSDRTDVDGALRLLPSNSMQAERAMLMGLKRFGVTAYEAAINAIPFGRRTMYLHAYQSYLFNVMASQRALMGALVVEGDLVSEADGARAEVATAAKAAELNQRLQHPLDCVMLPLAGSNVQYPTHAVGDSLRQILIEHGTAAALASSTDLKGAYRSLVTRPTDVEWRRVDGGVELQFSLGSGSFATMCLREILHIDL